MDRSSPHIPPPAFDEWLDDSTTAHVVYTESGEVESIDLYPNTSPESKRNDGRITE